MAGFANLGGLREQRSFVGLAIQNLDGLFVGLMGRFLCGCGQRTLLELTRSLAIEEQASEVTEDQRPRKNVGGRKSRRKPNRTGNNGSSGFMKSGNSLCVAVV